MRVKNEFLGLVARDFFADFMERNFDDRLDFVTRTIFNKILFKFLWQLPGALMKRRGIMARVKVSAKEMGNGFVKARFC